MLFDSAAGESPQARQESRAAGRLGRLLLDTGRPTEAEPFLRRALKLQESVLAPTHRVLAETRSDLGAALLAQGRIDDARPLLETAYNRLVELVGADKPESQRARKHLDQLGSRAR